MGTRGLTKVIYKNQVMVAQYGQWDHYLDGQGETIQKFLNNIDRKLFLKNLMSSNWIKEKEFDEYIVDAKSGLSDLNDLDSFYDIVLPEFTRGTGAEILNLIQAAPRLLRDNSGFEKDKLYCEGIFTLDFDKDIVRFNKKKWTFEQFKTLNLKVEAKR